MDFLTKNKFESKFNLKREDVFINEVLSYSIYINEEFEILFIIQTDIKYDKEDYFYYPSVEISDDFTSKFAYENRFYILNAENHFYLIPFLLECPKSKKLFDFKIIENVFENSKCITILRKINNEYDKINIELSDILYKTNNITKHFYNYWLKYGDLKRFNYCERIQIQLPRYIYENLDFNINILEPEEISNPDRDSDGYKYLMTTSDFKDYIKNRDEIVEICRNFCIKHQLNFNIKNEVNYYD